MLPRSDAAASGIWDYYGGRWRQGSCWIRCGLGLLQVLRDEIGTAVRQIKSRADHISLIMHGQEGEGESKEAFLGKEGAQVCVTHRCVTV